MNLPAVQLYDMATDPEEKNNVENKNPQIVKQLTQLLTKQVIEGRSTPGGVQQNDGPAYWEQLNWMSEK